MKLPTTRPAAPTPPQTQTATTQPHSTMPATADPRSTPITPATPPVTQSSTKRQPRENSSILTMGPTKVGKTELLATGAEWLWESFGKILFLYSADLSGFPDRVTRRIKQGLIRPFRIRTRDDDRNSLSFETMQRCSQGWIPHRFLDPLAGEVEVGCAMVRPLTTIYTQTCVRCGHGLRRTLQDYGVLFPEGITTCPQCKQPLAQHLARTYETMQTPGYERIGTFAYDGFLTAGGDWLMQDMSQRKMGGEKSALGDAEIVSGELTFYGTNRATVGQAQTRVQGFVANSLSIPNLVTDPWWTSLTTESTDESGRLPIVGPQLPGSAKTHVGPSWFGSVLEAAIVPLGDGTEQRRLYLSSWYDDQGRHHLCGHRGDMRFMPPVLNDPPYDADHPPMQQFTEFSLNRFLKLLKHSQELADKDDQFVGPGVDLTPASYGDLPGVEGVVAAPVRLAGEPTGQAAPRPSVRVARPQLRKPVKGPAPQPEPAQPQPLPAVDQPAEQAAELTLPPPAEQPALPLQERAGAVSPDSQAVPPPTDVAPAPPTPPASSQAAGAAPAPPLSTARWTPPPGVPPAPRKQSARPAPRSLPAPVAPPPPAQPPTP